MNEEITGEVKISQTILEETEKGINNVTDLREKVEKFLTERTTELLDIILAGAINLRSSDIHIEPEEKQIRLRVRIDGILHDVTFFAPKTYHLLLTRIKLLSRIKLNVTKRAQDGRFTIIYERNRIEVRTSSLPSEYGESIVMRLLDPRNLINIEQLGLRGDMLQVFEREIKRPNGMIILTGPTGAGKTTTLYAILKKINRPQVKIITIEDPIEYHLEGISQTQVNPKKGYTFASGLRAIVRQDPDVILVGEIRDLETAKIALQASLTGHLVLSTLHTNDAAGTVARLQALGAKAINISPALNIAIAQRLVRRVCRKCTKFVRPEKEERELIESELSSLPPKLKKKFLKKDFKIPKVQGCKFCNYTGYRGRIGIFEFFLVDEEMQSLILKSPSISELRNLAKKKGMISLRQDGFIKVLQGITTIEEVQRVTGE